jgi:DNA primase
MTWEQTLTEYAASQVDNRVREALSKRGVSEDQLAQYQLGYLHGELPDDVAPDFRKWAQGKIDDVFLLPLTNALGEVSGFQVRAIGQTKARYHDYLPDKREACFFGLGQAVEAMWETKAVFLVEGAFDLFPIQRAFPAVVATLTARTGPNLARVLRRLVDRVWVGYDMDEPGRRGCDKFLHDYGRDFEVYIVSYPKLDKVKDPGDLWELWGDSRLIPFIQDLTKIKPEGELYNG